MRSLEPCSYNKHLSNYSYACQRVLAHWLTHTTYTEWRLAAIYTKPNVWLAVCSFVHQPSLQTCGGWVTDLCKKLLYSTKERVYLLMYVHYLAVVKIMIVCWLHQLILHTIWHIPYSGKLWWGFDLANLVKIGEFGKDCRIKNSPILTIGCASMTLRIQIAKFKYHQYLLRANSPNLMLTELSCYAVVYYYNSNLEVMVLVERPCMGAYPSRGTAHVVHAHQTQN